MQPRNLPIWEVQTLMTLDWTRKSKYGSLKRVQLSADFGNVFGVINTLRFVPNVWQNLCCYSLHPGPSQQTELPTDAAFLFHHGDHVARPCSQRRDSAPCKHARHSINNHQNTVTLVLPHPTHVSTLGFPKLCFMLNLPVAPEKSVALVFHKI